MSNKATVYPDINSLMLQVAGMQKKLAEFSAFRANYQAMRSIYKYEMYLRGLERDWTRKLERVLREISEDTVSDVFDVRKFALKVLESRPKLML